MIMCAVCCWPRQPGALHTAQCGRRTWIHSMKFAVAFFVLVAVALSSTGGDGFVAVPTAAARHVVLQPFSLKGTQYKPRSVPGTGTGEGEEGGEGTIARDRNTRQAFLENLGAAAVAVLAWTSVADHALAGVARPSARGLAEANIELIGSGKQPVEVSVLYPKKWLVTKIAGNQISIQDYQFADRAFSMSTPLPSGTKSVEELPVSFFTDLLFDLNGPYGNFGKVDDFKAVGDKTLAKGKRTYRYVDLKFAALTQSMMQVPRRACVASTVVGNDVIIFTASILASRWPKISDIVGEMVESYRADLPQKRDASSLPFNRL